ncbi:hypothetical protein ACS0TY_013014 [Phlomoides rotata]
MILIVGMLESKVKINPAYQAKDARVDVFNQYNYEVSYHMTWISIKRVVENRYNPGTIVEWRHKDHNPATGVFTLGHIASNFNNRFTCVELKDLCYNAGRAFTVVNFDRIMNQIKELSPATFAYLDCIDHAKWTFCYDQGFRCGIMTTNMSECFNGVLVGARQLPITTIVRITFQQTKNFFVEREKLAIKFQQTNQRFSYNILKLYQKEADEGVTSRYYVDGYNNALQIASVSTFYDGSKKTYTYTVKLSTRECSCGKWSFTGIPCSHVMAVCRHFHFELADEEEWDETSFMLMHDPERLIKRRDVTTRIHNEMDWS